MRIKKRIKIVDKNLEKCNDKYLVISEPLCPSNKPKRNIYLFCSNKFVFLRVKTSIDFLKPYISLIPNFIISFSSSNDAFTFIGFSYFSPIFFFFQNNIVLFAIYIETNPLGS